MDKGRRGSAPYGQVWAMGDSGAKNHWKCTDILYGRPLKIFSLQDKNYKFIQKNINSSDIPIKSHEELILINKEAINDNHEKSNTQRSNQKST